MIRPVTCIAFLLACGSGLYLYQTKHRVKVLDDQIAQVVKQTNTLREQTRMLSAEWTLLNDPERLRQLANQFLTLQTVSPSQFTSLANLDSRLPPPVPPASPSPATPAQSIPVAAASGADSPAQTADTRPADTKTADAKPAEPGVPIAEAVASPVPPAAVAKDGLAKDMALAKETPGLKATPGQGAAGLRDHAGLKDAAASRPAAMAADDAARRAPPHPASTRAVVADQRPAAHRDADRHAVASRDVGRRGDLDRRVAEQRPASPRRIEPVAYEPAPRSPRPVMARRDPLPAVGGSFLGMAHTMTAPAPMPLPRPLPMNGPNVYYGGTGG